ncbi:solute carrier organic anion transporter family member 5A1-like [Tropilaelaps mercedesae]|uniref:Solute carrier organic anion transporter family member 5A1-like n=1 Tax=Tropilaelaps mercedesae TaxID=418985 RepID=A0A1V9XXN0_9ACAR|nr:solute carrier organic anion transporter family member 5A1-like [Tropilaelaps mercedesae]
MPTRNCYQDMFSTIRRLIKNPIFGLKTLGFAFIIIGTAGYGTTFTKYVEHQFGRSPSSASFISGTSKVLTNMFGIMVGGMAIQFFRPSPRKVAFYVAATEMIYMLGFVWLLFVGCHAPKISGIDLTTSRISGSTYMPQRIAPFHEGGRSSLWNECNTKCGCSVDDFAPVCSSDDQTLFSACYAGCRSSSVALNGTLLGYGDCGCIQTETLAQSSPVEANHTTVKTGKLRDKFTFTYLQYRISAFIPYPLIYGYVLDQSCILWSKTCNGRRGSCKFYDIDKLRYSVHLTTIAFLFIAIICYFAVVFYANRIQHFYSEPGDNGVSDTSDGPDKEDKKEKKSKNKNGEQNMCGKVCDFTL